MLPQPDFPYNGPFRESLRGQIREIHRSRAVGGPSPSIIFGKVGRRDPLDIQNRQPRARIGRCQKISRVWACNPYLVIGVLIEAIAYALAQQIPRVKQPDATMAILRMLMERLDANDSL